VEVSAALPLEGLKPPVPPVFLARNHEGADPRTSDPPARHISTKSSNPGCVVDDSTNFPSPFFNGKFSSPCFSEL